MPDMSGTEATHIIGATTQNDEETRAACMLAGMNEFLHKPLGLLNLAHQIGTAVPRAA